MDAIATHVILAAGPHSTARAYNGMLLEIDQTKPSSTTGEYVMLGLVSTKVFTDDIAALIGSRPGYHGRVTTNGPFEGWVWLSRTGQTYTARDLAEAQTEALRLTQETCYVAR